MIAAQILAGVALILFGVRFLRKGLDRLFGMKLAEWLGRMTGNRWAALGGGAVAGAIAPSSTGISLLSMQMLEAGKLDSRKMLAVLLGANIGITVMVQLLAFRIQEYAGIFLIIGILAFQFLHREVLRGIGQCLLALGFIFLAMQFIGGGARAFAGNPETVMLVGMLEGHPWLVLIATAILAVLMQSSTATIGLGLALGGTGLLPPALLALWVVGTNLGIACTSLIAGWPTLEGRRLGAANIIAKAGVAVPVLLAPGFAAWAFGLMPGAIERQMAMFHSSFNLVVGILAVALSGPLVALVRWMIQPPADKDLPRAVSYLDERALDSPSLALAHATRETLLMGDEARLMLEHFWEAFRAGNRHLAVRVQQEDDHLDLLNRNLCQYLSRISEEKNDAETRWQLTLHNFSNELESVGDVVDRQLCELFLKRPELEARLPEREMQTLDHLHREVLKRLDQAQGLLTTRGADVAREFLAGKERLNAWCREVQLEHYKRLEAGDSSLLATSPFFLDLLDGYRRINSHLSSLGYAFQKPVEHQHRRPKKPNVK